MNKRRKSIIWKISKDKFEEICKSKESLISILKHFGLVHSSGNYGTLKRRIEEEGIDISHIKLGLGHNKGRVYPLKQISKERFLKEYLTKDSSKHYGSIKELIIRFDLIKYECQECKLPPFWNGEKLVLQLDHINGIRNDHRLKNLRFLCPNCHTQTPTFSGKRFKKICNCKDCGVVIKKTSNRCVECRKINSGQKTKIKWPTNEELEKLIWSNPMTKVSSILGVSDSAIRKRCKKNSVKLPSCGFWLRADIKTNQLNSLKDPLEDCNIKDLVWKKSLQEISKELNISIGRIITFCDKNKIQRPPINYWNTKHIPSKEHLLNLLQNNSVEEIAGQYNVVPSTVYKWIRKFKK